MRRVDRPAQRADDEGTTLVRRPVRSAPRSEAHARPAPARPAATPRPEPKQEPRGSFDLGAWVHGMMNRAAETPSEPFKQGVVRREPAASPRAPERSLDNQGLARWAFGLVDRTEEAPAPRAAGPRPSAKRKALTMPDLFDGGAVPPCLQDD